MRDTIGILNAFCTFDLAWSRMVRKEPGMGRIKVEYFRMLIVCYWVQERELGHFSVWTIWNYDRRLGIASMRAYMKWGEKNKLFEDARFLKANRFIRKYTLSDKGLQLVMLFFSYWRPLVKSCPSQYTVMKGEDRRGRTYLRRSVWEEDSDLIEWEPDEDPII
jgi:hypothetical protein